MDMCEEYCFWFCRQIRRTIQECYNSLPNASSEELSKVLRYEGAKKSHSGTNILNRTAIEHSWVDVSTLRWTG